MDPIFHFFQLSSVWGGTWAFVLGFYDACHQIIRNAAIVAIRGRRPSISPHLATTVTSVLRTYLPGSQKSHFVHSPQSLLPILSSMPRFLNPCLTITFLSLMQKPIMPIFNRLRP
ncbi:hypothetical protein JAAARDRAFT_42292 [Jaapia argillacea MUCL 33604]|uniref:Uncharacterized protein n=1 Tax=Jaapia argillacea MUCL 33604 TaxID=933084 RepID=A0A067P5L0_9AGAM|nr:hypothetical protein JAAARDRAFT_42292 [Jaapia argillacea MUCL 33604]